MPGTTAGVAAGDVAEPARVKGCLAWAAWSRARTALSVPGEWRLKGLLVRAVCRRVGLDARPTRHGGYLAFSLSPGVSSSLGLSLAPGLSFSFGLSAGTGGG